MVGFGVSRVFSRVRSLLDFFSGVGVMREFRGVELEDLVSHGWIWVDVDCSDGLRFFQERMVFDFSRARMIFSYF